jgi:hypothetical protein
MKAPKFHFGDGDLMDIFLGRMLKNWVAGRQPSLDGRERLLAAAARPALVERRRSYGLLHILRYLSSTPNYHGFQEEILSVSLSQSMIWSFHLATSNRILA